MSINIVFLFCLMKPVSRMRKADLAQIASDMQLGLDSTFTRTELIKRIHDIPHFSRHLRCYNPCDPCTLVPLHAIPVEYYIEWNQNKKRFGADKRSIRRLFDYQQFTLPFALDLEEDETTDMRTCAELVESIKDVRDVVIDPSPELSMASRFLFGIEHLCGGNFGYINGNISQKILSNPNTSEIHFLVLNSIFNVSIQLETECQFVMYMLIDLCYQPLMWTIPSCKNDLLRAILDVLTFFVGVVGDRGHNVIFAIFNDI
jgi:hypothetical protein